MKPYYQDSRVTLFHGDCRYMLPVIDGIGAIVCDPPYGISLANHDAGNARRNGSYAIAGDGCRTIGDFILSSFEALPLILFASPWAPWGGEWRQMIVWDKGGAVGGGGDTTLCLKRSWELIQVARNRVLNGPRAESVWRFPVVPADSALHPAAKPVGLMARLIDTFTAPGDLICDPCAGSGATLEAAKLLGREAIGIELDEAHCETAARRLQQEVLAL